MVEGKEKASMDVFSCVACVAAGADVVPCQLCRVCMLLCVLSVNGLAVAGLFHLICLFTAGSSWGIPGFWLWDALTRFRSASGDKVSVASGLPGPQG